MTLRSFIAAASAVLLLLLISSLTWSSCVDASPFDDSDESDTTLTDINEEIHKSSNSELEKDIDGMLNTPEVTTTGTCKAILPDGRLQTVVYTCAPTGYSAVVQYHKSGNQSAPAAPASPVQQQQQQHLQPITEILFRPTIESSSTSRVTTETETESITTPAPAAHSLSTKKSESIVPHRFHVGSDEKVRTVSLVQLQHSLPSLPLSTASSSSTTTSTTTTTPATSTIRGRRRSTTVAASVDVTSSTTPAAITRRRKTRLNIPTEGSTILQSEPSL